MSFHAYAKCSLRNYSSASAIIYISQTSTAFWVVLVWLIGWSGMWAAVGLSLAVWLLGLVVVFVHIVYIFAFVAAEYLLV